MVKPKTPETKNFIEKYDTQNWYDYVANRVYKGKIDVKCHMNGGTLCYNRPTGPLEDLYGRVLAHSKGYECVINEDAYHCVDSKNHSACLVAYFHADGLPAKLTKNQEKKLPVVLRDVNNICEQSIDGLAVTGDILKLNQNINLRRTPGGLLMKLAKKDEVSEVFDYVVEADSGQKRYYKISIDGDVGYIYAGDEDSHKKWAGKISPNSARGQIPGVGDTVKITARNGINLRKKIKGQKIGLVTNGDEVEVEYREFREKSGKMYLKVTHEGVTGFIYGGELKPYSVNNWVEKVNTESVTGQLAANVNFAFPRTCPKLSCGITGQTLKASNGQRFEILEVQGQWVRVQKGVANQAGWLQADMVNEL